MRRTLRGRVSMLGLVVIAVWVIVLTAAFNIVLAHRLGQEMDVVLRTRATTAAATLATNAAGEFTVHDPVGDEALDSGIWVYSRGKAIERPAGAPDLQAVADSLADRSSRYLGRGDYRFFVLPVQRNGRSATVVASLSTAPYRHARTEALEGSGIVALLVLLGAYPVLRLAAGRALRPVDAMTRQASDWSAHALTERFGAGQRFQEVQILASTLDQVLDRLSAVVRHERQLPAELSHELRTPLSRIVAETDLLLSREHSAAELDAAHRAIGDSAMAMGRILETLLSASRVDIQEAPGRCQLKPVLDAVAHTRGRGHGSGRRIDVAVADDLAVGADAAVVEQIITPVVDNACRYARQVVTITARRSRDAVSIDIDDDGAGVPDELREAVFEPGRRINVEDGHDGAGLGLALARRLARAAAGDVTIVGEASTFRVCLPPA